MEYTNPTTVDESVYDDDVVRMFVGATVIWGVVGMLVGVVIALQLACCPANLGLPWTTFGRLRPLHTNAVIFAFAGNICFAGIYYSMERLLKTRMWNDKLSRFYRLAVGPFLGRSEGHRVLTVAVGHRRAIARTRIATHHIGANNAP